MLSARNRLKRHLNEVDSTSSSLSSPIQRSLKVAAVQSHAREVSSLTANESPDAHTPGTKTFLTTINALESVAGSKCLVKDPEAAVLEIAEKYLDSDSGCVSRFAKKELFAEPSRLPPYGNAKNLLPCC